MPQQPKTKGKRFSEGARRLWLVLEERKWSQTDLSNALGKASSVVNRWLHGERCPDRRSALLVREIFSIDLALWSEAPEESSSSAQADQVAA